MDTKILLVILVCAVLYLFAVWFRVYLLTDFIPKRWKRNRWNMLLASSLAILVAIITAILLLERFGSWVIVSAFLLYAAFSFAPDIFDRFFRLFEKAGWIEERITVETVIIDCRSSEHKKVFSGWGLADKDVWDIRNIFNVPSGLEARVSICGKSSIVNNFHKIVPGENLTFCEPSPFPKNS